MSRGLFEHLINIEDLDKSVITDIIRDADRQNGGSYVLRKFDKNKMQF